MHVCDGTAGLRLVGFWKADVGACWYLGELGAVYEFPCVIGAGDTLNFGTRVSSWHC